MTNLYVKYRPQKWDDVIGQKAVVSSIRRTIKANQTHAYLLCGPAGTGKTTVARLIAGDFGCRNPIEIDAATHSGADAMRSIADAMRFHPLGNDKAKIVIIDECHRLSSTAWDVLLKPMEEPAEHSYWVLCTTNDSKVPKTIQTRCSVHTFKRVGQNDLEDLLIDISESEKQSVDDSIIGLCAKEADGSPRQAIMNLNAVLGCSDLAEAKQLIQKAAEADEPALKLCRYLVEHIGAWKYLEMVKIIASMPQDSDAEGIRHMVLGYVTKVLIGSKDEGRASALGIVLDMFGDPYPDRAKISSVLISLRRLVG